MTPWPNQNEVVDGVVPMNEVPQEMYPQDDELDADLDFEMED